MQRLIEDRVFALAGPNRERDGIVVPDRCQRSKSVRVRNWEVGSDARTPTTEGDTQWVQGHRRNRGSLAFHYHALWL